MTLFICVNFGSDTLSRQLFPRLNIFVEIERKWVVIYGATVADPYTTPRPLLPAICIAGVRGLQNCLHEFQALPVFSLDEVNLGQKIPEKIGRVWGGCPLAPCSQAAK